MILLSNSFKDGNLIPACHATKEVEGGDNISPHFSWKDMDDETITAIQSFALIFWDKHPVAQNWIHWLVSSIPSGVTEIQEESSGVSMPVGSVEHVNSYGEYGYGGPQPPIGSGSHEYVAEIYALDIADLNLSDAPSLTDFKSAVSNHVLDNSSISGFFRRD